MDPIPLHFIGEPVEVHFARPPALEKIPASGELPLAGRILRHRRGAQRVARLPSPRAHGAQYAATACLRGCRERLLGRRQDYFRVRTSNGGSLIYMIAPRTLTSAKAAGFG
jgi:hypothetical protein